MFLRRSTRRSAASLALSLALALAVAGCGSVTPSAAPTQAATPPPPTTGPVPTIAPSSRPAAEVFAEIRAAVEAIRGLQPTASVDPVTIDEVQLRTNLEAEFDATYTPAQLKDIEELLAALGLIPGHSSLRTLTLDLQAGQVAGYYSPVKDELFVVNRTGRLGPVDEATYAHEFTHQLQDQRFDLDALGIDVADQSDRSLGRLALVEGDATSVQSTWMTTNLDSAELGELLAAALDPVAMAALNNAPAYLRDTALFGYQDGLAFVGRLLANGGYAAVDAAFADPPDSTEQVLHPEKYLTREQPIEVGLPARVPDALGAGWAEVGRDTLGELILRIWLTEGGVPGPQARTASAGWGGDRLALYRGTDGKTAVLVRTMWDTPLDAEEFKNAAQAAVTKLLPGGLVEWELGSTTVDILSAELVSQGVVLGN
ncbi:MAG: hypothetical protein ABI620_04635 [Chloroflexota bacterium]